MSRKQRIFCLVLAALMIVSLTACKSKDPGSSSASPPADSAAANQQSGQEPEAGGTSQGGDSAAGAKLTGSLNLIDLDDRDPSVLRGVRITGNSVGTAEGFNGRESSLTDVRCIFELGEWIEFYPDTDKEYALRVWVLRHRDDQEYYNTAKFSDLDPNFAAYCDLHYPADEEKPEEWHWGNFYLHQEECEPGYYDFVFTYEGKAIAVLQTRFYKEGELSAKPDAELEALMHQ